MITYTQANKIIDNIFGNIAFTPSTTYYLGLSTSTVNPTGTGVTEPVGGAYTRIPVINNKTNFTTAANGVVFNTSQIEFPESTAPWGTITYVFIADAATAGNILYYDALTTARAVQTQTSLIFVPNSIKIQLS